MPDSTPPAGRDAVPLSPDAVAVPVSWSAVVTNGALLPEERWHRLLALLPAQPTTPEVAALDRVLDQTPTIPSWARKAPALWRRALLTGQPAPWVPIVRVLDLRRMRVRDHGLTMLATRPELRGITHIKLYHNTIGNRGLSALVQSAAFGQVVALNLTDNRIGAAGVQALTQTTCLPALREVYLGRNWIGDRGAAILAATPFGQQLTVLDVRDTNLSAAGKELLATSPYLQKCRIRGLDPA